MRERAWNFPWHGYNEGPGLQGPKGETWPMRIPIHLLLAALLLGGGVPASPAGPRPRPPAGKQKKQEAPQEDPARLEALREFRHWLQEWKEGLTPLRTNEGPDLETRAKMEAVFSKVAALGDPAAARVLFQAATVPPPPLGGQDTLRMEPWYVRRVARKLLAGMEGREITDWLASLLASKDPDRPESPVRAALEILSWRKDGARALPKIEKLALSGRPGTRLTAIHVLGLLGDPRAVPLLRRLLKEGRPEIRCAGCAALSALLSPYTDQTLPPSRRRGKLPSNLVRSVLEDLGSLLVTDRAWQVRAAACDALLHLKTSRAVPFLIKGLAAEEKRRGKRDWCRRVALGIGRALRGLTGMDLPLEHAAPWKSWWRKEGKSMRVRRQGAPKDQGKGAAGVYAKYFNIDVESDRILFLVDASGSMARKVKLKQKYAGLPHEAVKFDLVRKELTKVILSLPSTAAVNVIFFNQDVTPFRPMSPGNPGLMPMTEANKEALIEFLNLAVPQGLTNLYGALKLALRFGRGAGKKRWKGSHRSRTSPLTFDTIYLLSDGAPTTGEVIDPQRILELVDQANAVKKVVIHTISFGDVNNAKFMDELARRNGGRHVHLD